MSFLDTFGDDWKEESEDESPVEEQVEAVAEETPEQTEPEAPEDKEKPEAEPVETAEETKQVPTVPYDLMKAERAKRQEAERRLAELQAQVSQPQSPKLDAYEDPEGFNNHVRSQMEQIRWEARAEVDGIRAEAKHGKETVEAAMAWVEGRSALDPTLGARIRSSAAPVDLVVQEYQQSRALELLNGRSFEEAAREWAEKQGVTVSPGATPQPKPSSPTPPRSLASRPGQGGVNQNTADAFEGIFSSSSMGLRR